MFYFDENFGLFVGKLTHNIFYKHYALQLTVAGNLTMEFSDGSHYTRTFKETFGVTSKFLFLKE